MGTINFNSGLPKTVFSVAKLFLVNSRTSKEGTIKLNSKAFIKARLVKVLLVLEALFRSPFFEALFLQSKLNFEI